MQPTSGKQAAEADDDDIVAGPQKTSLKCPVGIPATLVVVVLNALVYSAKLLSYQYPVSFLALYSRTVLRCLIMVFGKRADDNVVLSSMREID
jgi:hypothetical protein